MRRFPSVLTIAGSDSGGGAGIQADLKTITALGGFGTCAITALTAQNTVEVRGRLDVAPEFVAAQIDAVVEDIGVDSAKTGMLGRPAVVEAVAEVIRRRRIAPLVVDPVMVSKSGAALLHPSAVDKLKDVLLPCATVVCPNLAEAEALCGMKISSMAQMEKAANLLLDSGAKWALVKGGHLEGDPVDVLSNGEATHRIKRERVDTRDTHGTGCTYSAAIATFLGKGPSVPDAVEKARDALQSALASSLRLGRGYGPVNHFAIFAGGTTDEPQ